MSIELALGIIGTVTGIVGTILSVYSILRQNPDLHVEVLSCKHKASKNQKSTILGVEYVVYNKGDRGTQLNKIEAYATDFNGLEHHSSQALTVDYLGANNNTKKIQTILFHASFSI